MICVSFRQLELTCRGKVGPAVNRAAASPTREGFLAALVSWCATLFILFYFNANNRMESQNERVWLETIYVVARGEKKESIHTNKCQVCSLRSEPYILCRLGTGTTK